MSETHSSLQALLNTEQRLRFADFGAEDALSIGLYLIQRAKRDQRPVLINVQLGERVLFHYECPGITPDNVRWMEMKARVTELYEHSSYYMGQLLEQSGLSLQQCFQLDPAGYSASGGCFPILLKSGAMIGHISVSGYTPEGDHQAVVEAIAHHIGEEGTTWKQEFEKES